MMIEDDNFIKLEIKYYVRNPTLFLRQEILLVCPVCKRNFIREFVTAPNISDWDLDDFVIGQKNNFYDVHVLDCKG